MKARIKTKVWLFSFACFIALMGILSAALASQETGQIAKIYQDGVCIRSIDLSAVTKPERFVVTDGSGHENVIALEPGRIRVAEANCPDHVCVQTGWISNGLRPIVCLPAKLSIQMTELAQTEDEGIDALIG